MDPTLIFDYVAAWFKTHRLVVELGAILAAPWTITLLRRTKR